LLQQSGSWDGQDKIEAPLILPDTNPEPERISEIRATAAFTAEFEEHTAPNTNYKFVLKQLRGFSDAKGYGAIDQWTPIDVGEFRASWGVLPSSAATNMSVVKAFFEFCHANEQLLPDRKRKVSRPSGNNSRSTPNRGQIFRLPHSSRLSAPSRPAPQVEPGSLDAITDKPHSGIGRDM
jgi:hypothetical protein